MLLLEAYLASSLARSCKVVMVNLLGNQSRLWNSVLPEPAEQRHILLMQVSLNARTGQGDIHVSTQLSLIQMQQMHCCWQQQSVHSVTHVHLPTNPWQMTCASATSWAR